MTPFCKMFFFGISIFNLSVLYMFRSPLECRLTRGIEKVKKKKVGPPPSENRGHGSYKVDLFGRRPFDDPKNAILNHLTPSYILHHLFNFCSMDRYGYINNLI